MSRTSSETAVRNRARRLLRYVVRPHQSETCHAAVVRWLGQLVLLDSWSPDSHRLSCPRSAWNDVLVEWTRSGDLTKAQAAAPLALDESTAWRV